MKKNVISVIISLVFVLCVSLGVTYLLTNKPGDRVFSDGSCLNSKVTEDMSRIDIARIYSEACVTIYAQTTSIGTSLGSGVCVASQGYQTENVQSVRGSYFVTNYHVVSNAVDPFYSNCTTSLSVELEGSTKRYDAKLLWSDKNLDVAVIYSSDIVLNWVEMKDRVVACEDKDKLNYDEVFVIGTPLDKQYKNTLTLGNVSNNNCNLREFTATDLFVYKSGGKDRYTIEENFVPVLSQDKRKYTVVDNVYENAIMMNVDITNGNSGGGVFDSYGNLIGLATLGKDNHASMNFFVPVYPITLVLDKIISSNEKGNAHSIISADSLGIKVIDKDEAKYFCTTYLENLKTNPFVISFNGKDQFYIDGTFYPQEDLAFLFKKDEKGNDIFKDYVLNDDVFKGGVYVVESEHSSIQKGYMITALQKSGEGKTKISNRNDLIYFLLSCDKGQMVNVSTESGVVTITL